MLSSGWTTDAACIHVSGKEGLNRLCTEIGHSFLNSLLRLREENCIKSKGKGKMLSGKCKSLQENNFERQQLIQEKLIQRGQAEQVFEGFVYDFLTVDSFKWLRKKYIGQMCWMVDPGAYFMM